MAIEFRTLTLIQDENFTKEVERLQSEGWQIVPGTCAQVVYFLQRESNSMGGTAGLAIDESKIEVVKGAPDAKH